MKYNQQLVAQAAYLRVPRNNGNFLELSFTLLLFLKVELHLHLDGSLSEDFIRKMAEKRNIELPVPVEDIRQEALSQFK